ncbi:MAG: FAD-dependent monooxygenase [Actinomycetota bacterium]|nr:FAD-dependent monooxygenase [Actinomycetota bacterium]
MAEHFDVIIVGARCAGSPLATLLADAGLRVCVLDRARFPSDTPSTHGVQPTGVKILDRLGVLESLLKVSPPIEHGILALGDVRIELDDISGLLGAPMVNVRRIVLDAILVDAAAAAGAEVRTQTAIRGLVEEDGRVVGVRTATAELRAPLVVGADGARSTVARLVEAEEYHQTPPGRIFLWAYFDDAGGDSVSADNDGLWLGKIGDHGFLASPTDGGLFLAAVTASADRTEEVHRDLSASFAAGLAGWPELEASLAGARRVGPIRVMERWHGFFRRSAGPGWVLVGDAGHFKDPTAGQGISDALRQSVTLAAAIEQALGGPSTADRALRDWWYWRDRDAWEMYWFAHDLGAPGLTPLLVQEVQRRIAADPRLTEGLLRVFDHDLAPSKVFTPSVALAAVSTALRARPGQRQVILRQARTLVADDLRRRMSSPRAVPGCRGRLRTGATSPRQRAPASSQ